MEVWRKYQSAPSKLEAHGRKRHRLVQKYGVDICDAWREGVDILPIFADLLAAPITAFNVEPYQWLQADTTDTTSQFLAFLASEYAQSRNTSLPAFLLHLTQQPQQLGSNISSATTHIDAFWFLSLTLSLTTVSISNACVNSNETLLYHTKTPSALSSNAVQPDCVSWHVPTFLSTLPPSHFNFSLLLLFTGPFWIYFVIWNHGVVVAVKTAALEASAYVSWGCYYGFTRAPVCV